MMLVFAIVFMGAQPAQSQASEAKPLPSPEAIRAAMVIEDPNDPAFSIGKEIRCPVCQGRPIADSPSDMAMDMMRLVRKMLAEGKTREEILEYFARSYGDSVMLTPRKTGVTSLVWLAPPFAVLLLILYAVMLVRRSKTAPKTATQSKSGTDKSTKNNKKTPAASSGDNYLDAIRREVDE